MTPTHPDALRALGWSRYDRRTILGEHASTADGALDELQAFFRDLPRDRYAPESGRRRRHTRGVFLPWEDRLSWMPNLDDPEYGAVVDYNMQGYNSEFSTLKRQMPAIPDAIRRMPLIEQIVRFDIAQTLWLGDFARKPLSVGVGCITLSVEDPDQQVASTPDELHQDGGEVAFTFIHLVLRDNVDGALDYIAPPRCVGMMPWELAPSMIEAEFTLEEPLDTFAVHNSRVSHYVSAARRGARDELGQRGVLIVAISPFVKQL